MPNPIDADVAEQLRHQKTVSGVDDSGGFGYRLDLSFPCIATAIHAGHRVREELASLMEIPETLRLAEEDAATDEIIAGCPSTIFGLDSRAEYDLNRPPETALALTPEMFWGIRVYRTSPSDEMNRCSLGKYERFFRFVTGVAGELLDRFGFCVIYDVHSYNIFRQMEKGHPSPPLFNLGTRLIDRNRWKPSVEDWLQCLKHISISGAETTVAENDVFDGKGEFARRMMGWNRNILVLPTEISKRYMDEKTGVVDREMVETLRSEMAKAVSEHCRLFYNRGCS